MTRWWVNFVHVFLALTGYWAAAAALWNRNRFLASSGLLWFLLWGFTEIVGVSINIWAVNRTWRAQYANADPAMQEILKTNLTGFAAIWDAIFFVILISFLLGTLFLGLAAIRGAGLERWLGGPVTASGSSHRHYSSQRVREYHCPWSTCGLVVSGAATRQSSTDGRLALAHRRHKSITLPWLISFSLGRMKVLVFGNSGSGKSTYARALAAREGLAHLDSDSIVWGFGEPGKIAVQRPEEAVAASLRNFIDSHAAWVIEGCYGELIRAASVHCTLLVFLNPGIDACLANNLKRPWESHKYPSLELQNSMLDQLQK